MSDLMADKISKFMADVENYFLGKFTPEWASPSHGDIFAISCKNPPFGENKSEENESIIRFCRDKGLNICEKVFVYEKDGLLFFFMLVDAFALFNIQMYYQKPPSHQFRVVVSIDK